jgi:hypothetical protein
VGQYEFIYENTGYTQVGQDYGGQATDVSGNTLFVRQKASEGCNSESWALVLATLGDDATDPSQMCDNGAGGSFSCDSSMSNEAIAQAACESVYGGCTTGSCGYFYYYYESGGYSCNCNKPTGEYEFIYNNAGYSQVGQDYGGQSTDVSGNSLFVRVKYSEGCNGDSWYLALADLGTALAEEEYQPECDNGAGGGFECSSSMSNAQIAEAACLSVYSECTTGSCGYFYYYYESGGLTCNCNKPVGEYEFIYENGGYTQVGQDYGGRTTSVEGNNLFVRVKTDDTCSSESWTLALADLGEVFIVPLCDNGAGGGFECDGLTSNEEIALAACNSVYDNCEADQCGYFYYYHGTDDFEWACDCNVPVGQYEFIYDNTGYSQVGQDYGGQSTDVSGNTLFVRRKYSEGCNSDSWELVLADLGEATYFQGCDNGAGGVFECDAGMSNQEIAEAACLSVYEGCAASSCGYFYYYHTTDSDVWSCNCNIPVGQYEFIYDNTGYTQVGQDYGGQSTDVSGNSLFVRQKYSEGCNSDSWILVLEDLGNDADGCGEGDYDIHLVDSFGDGWNGATMTVIACDLEGTQTEVVSGLSMDGSFESVDVCILETAGYEITVGGGDWDSEISWSILDSNWEVVMEGGAGTVSTCPEPCTDGWDLHLVDSFGDGWNGATIDVVACDGTVYESGLSMSGSFEEADVCLPESDGYIISVGGGDWDSEITWTLFDSDGNVVMEGEAGYYSTCSYDTCDNGAGGTFDCDSYMSNSQIAQNACLSVYDSCDYSSCGYFYYWHTTDTDQA